VLADKARRLLALVERALPPAGSIPTAAAHGSYIAEHVVLSGRRTAAIDFDEYGIADPDREVAWFIISLQRSALKVLGSFHALDPLTAEFLQGYGAEKGSDRLPRVALYRGIECLHRGRRDLVGRVPSAPEWAELMVDEGLRALTTTEAS